MRIKVKAEGKNIRIFLPSCMIFNGLVATIGAAYLKKEGEKHQKTPQIPASALRRLFREILRAKRRHKGWNVVEVATAEGEDIVIRL